ncbi:VOC family protein [Hazenella coriacea]|uniref:VOC domain-containing protein n=1 Tax=Hazenella coriacea TaxID=1179467 RepID=A0A4R3LA14_9BACL|nr:VOC family protein [Hazenella coriacea]TCS95965.1 hypothetical protein EDD58_102549 [Hazenella coriacea]
MNKVVHFELHAPHPERAVRFYESVFGWRVEQTPDNQDVWTVQSGSSSSRCRGNIYRSHEQPSSDVNSIEVASIEEYAKKISQHGGEMVVSKVELPGTGYLAYCLDVEKNLFGMLERTISL